MNNDTTLPSRFTGLQQRKSAPLFDGGGINSDGGVMLLALSGGNWSICIDKLHALTNSRVAIIPNPAQRVHAHFFNRISLSVQKRPAISQDLSAFHPIATKSAGNIVKSGFGPGTGLDSALVRNVSAPPPNRSAEERRNRCDAVSTRHHGLVEPRHGISSRGRASRFCGIKFTAAAE
jgi:hypothetical protein